MPGVKIRSRFSDDSDTTDTVPKQTAFTSAINNPAYTAGPNIANSNLFNPKQSVKPAAAHIIIGGDLTNNMPKLRFSTDRKEKNIKLRK